MTGTQIDDGWEEQILARWDEYASTNLGPRIREDAKRYAPKVTGELAGSIESHIEGHTLIVKAHAPYAAWVELGTRPHIIRAHPRVRGGWTGPYTGKPGPGQHTLRWFDESGGPVFAMEVHHPGTHPQPYLRTALFQALTD